MFNYGTTPATYYPPSSNKIPVEYTGSSTLDDRDRRRRRSGSASTSSTKDKDSLTNMHLVRVSHPDEIGGFSANEDISDVELKIALHNGHSENARRSTSKGWSTSSKISTKSTRTFFNHIAGKPTRYRDSMLAFLS